MRRVIVALCIFASFALTLGAEESSFYPMRVPVVKVYSHAEGLKVVYQKAVTGLAEVYIPVSWFKTGGKAELISGRNPAYPYMVVYLKDGKFSHLRLYVQESSRDPSWGILDSYEGRGKFANEDIQFVFQ